MSEKFHESSPRDREDKMSVCTNSYDPERSRDEAFALVREIAGAPFRPVQPAIKRAVARLKPYLGLTLSRTEDIWRREARLIRAEEMDALRAAAEARRQKLEAGRVATAELADLYFGMAERLRQIDEDIHRFEIDRLERQARQICPVDRTGVAPARVAPPASGNGGGE